MLSSTHLSNGDVDWLVRDLFRCHLEIEQSDYRRLMCHLQHAENDEACTLSRDGLSSHYKDYDDEGHNSKSSVEDTGRCGQVGICHRVKDDSEGFLVWSSVEDELDHEQFRWWDEFDTDSGSDTDGTIYEDTENLPNPDTANKRRDNLKHNSPVRNPEVPEVEPPPDVSGKPPGLKAKKIKNAFGYKNSRSATKACRASVDTGAGSTGERPPPLSSRKRTLKEDSATKGCSKRVRWWDECDNSNTDTINTRECTDTSNADCGQNAVKTTGTSVEIRNEFLLRPSWKSSNEETPVKHSYKKSTRPSDPNCVDVDSLVTVENLLPSPSQKRSVEESDKGSSKRFRFDQLDSKDSDESNP